MSEYRGQVEVGRFVSETPIMLGKEREVGVSYEASAPTFGLSALGATPREALDGLMRFINERGINGQGKVEDGWEVKLAELLQ